MAASKVPESDWRRSRRYLFQNKVAAAAINADREAIVVLNFVLDYRQQKWIIDQRGERLIRRLQKELKFIVKSGNAPRVSGPVPKPLLTKLKKPDSSGKSGLSEASSLTRTDTVKEFSDPINPPSGTSKRMNARFTPLAPGPITIGKIVGTPFGASMLPTNTGIGAA